MHCRFDGPGGPVVARLYSHCTGPGRDDLLVVVQDISELKQAERTRDEFLAHLTHELRTPLTNIQAYAETLNDDFFDDEKTRRECYNVIMAEARRLAKLIEDVLGVSQIDAGAAHLTRPARSAWTTCCASGPRRSTRRRRQGDRTGAGYPPHLPACTATASVSSKSDRPAEQCRSSSPPGGAVKAAIEADQRGWVPPCVADTGIGIAPRWQKLIFEKFFRVQDPVVQATQGTGLGLALVRDVVRLHGGSIQVESTSGAGGRLHSGSYHRLDRSTPVTGRSASEST